MKRIVQLTPQNTTRAVGLDWHAGALFIANFTGSPVLVRVGAPEIPNVANADYIVPGNGYQTIIVSANQFGVAFQDATLLNTQPAANVGRLATCLFLSDDEQIPNFGAATFESLSLSDLTNGFVSYSGGITSITFDLGGWGGALVTVIPDSTSGQGVIIPQVSSDGLNWKSLQTWTLWPNVPIILSIPRTARFYRHQILNTTIAGEPAITGAWSLRATLTEIQQMTYTPLSPSITKPYNVPSLNQTSFFFVTIGIPSLSIALKNTAGTRGQLIVYMGDTATGPWRMVAQREQILSAGSVNDTIYLDFGQAGVFTRVDVVETGNSGPLQGTVVMSVVPDPDPTHYLQRIMASLGDPSTPNVANLNIYQELDAIRLATDTLETLLTTSNTQLTAINANTDTLESLVTSSNTKLDTIHVDLGITGQVHTDLNTIHVDLANIRTGTDQLPNIKLDTANLAGIKTDTANLASINTHEANIEGSQSFYNPRFDAWLSAINNNTDTVESLLTNIKTDLDTLVARRTSFAATDNIGFGAAGWIRSAINIPNAYISKVMITHSAAALCYTLVALGTAAVAVTNISQALLNPGIPLPLTYDSGGKGADGWSVGATNTWIWVFLNAAGTADITVVYVT